MPLYNAIMLFNVRLRTKQTTELRSCSSQEGKFSTSDPPPHTIFSDAELSTPHVTIENTLIYLPFPLVPMFQIGQVSHFSISIPMNVNFQAALIRNLTIGQFSTPPTFANFSPSTSLYNPFSKPYFSRSSNPTTNTSCPLIHITYCHESHIFPQTRHQQRQLLILHRLPILPNQRVNLQLESIITTLNLLM